MNRKKEGRESHGYPTKTTLKNANFAEAMTLRHHTLIRMSRKYQFFQDLSVSGFLYCFFQIILMLSTSIVVLSWQESGLSSGDIDPSTYWRALVKEIRQSKNGKVWLKVNWFYSVEHLLQPGTLEEQWSVISLILIYIVLTHNYTQSRYTFNHGKK